MSGGSGGQVAPGGRPKSSTYAELSGIRDEILHVEDSGGSTLSTPDVPPEILAHGRTFLERVNPVTLFAAAVLYSTPLLFTIDAVSAGVALALSVVALLLAGVTLRQLLRRAWPMLIAAPVSAVSMLLYAKPGGTSYGRFLLAEITDNSIELSIAIGLRVLAVGVPTLALLGGIDPTRLADGLAQVVRLPARFVLGALAGMRLFSVFREDWIAMTQARRARGLGDRGLIRRLFTMAFALLVLAIRRGGTLATAMEARGFGAGPRTWARPSTTGWRDTVLLAIALALALLALAVSLAVGSFRLIGAG